MTESAAGPTGSTVPRRQLGRYLRDLRNRAPLTLKAAARELEWSEAKMWRIETGQTSLRSLDVQAMCEIYGAPTDLKEALKGLAKETKAKGWWHAYGDVIPEGFNLYIGLEEATSSLDTYENELVPGLLQTANYAETIIREHSGEDDAEIERRVNLRTTRQRLLTRVTDPPDLRLVLNEAVLHRPIGGHEVMAEQLAHLVEVGQLPNVMIRVIPFHAGMHHGVVSGPFVVLRFQQNDKGRDNEPPTVYADGYTGSLYLDKPHEVARYDTAFSNIWETAFDEQASRRLISELAEHYEHN